MKSIFDRLNLRPQERRLVVGVGILLFAVVNFAFVFPRFGDLGRTQHKKREADRTLKRFHDELGRRTHYERELKRLESVGAYLPPEEQGLDFQREVYQQAQQTGVMIQDVRSGLQQRTNSFFEEQTLVARVITGEKELVDFLWGLGKGQSLTRVSSMSLQRDPTQTKLAGNLTLVKSFQKKPPRAAPTTTVAAAAKAKTTPAPAAKAASPVAKSGATNPPAARTNATRRTGKT